MAKPIIIGTRGSPLALAQAETVRRLLLDAHSDLGVGDVLIKVIKTTGDKILDRHLMSAGGKGLFTKEIEEALLSKDIDCAVHSCKDMPTRLPDGLKLIAFLEREDPRDAFISNIASAFQDLDEGATLGTASLRRRAQALRLRPDLEVVTFRGNVQTRLRKLDEGFADATFLARAGLNRLGMADVASETLDTDRFLPAPAQGIVTIESRQDDTEIAQRLSPLHNRESEIAAYAERGFLAAIDGSCRTPIAALAVINDTRVTLTAQLLSVDGQTEFKDVIEGQCGDAWSVGCQLGQDLRNAAGTLFFEKLAKEAEAFLL